MKTDTYYAYAWVIILAVPLIAILFIEEWSRASWFVFIGICIIIAVGNMIRAQASLPIVCLAVPLLFFKLFKKKKLDVYRRDIVLFIKCNIPLCIAIFLLLTSQYFLTNIFPGIFFNLLYGINVTNSSFGPWHTLYLGFGWEENKYGIVWLDSFASNKVYEIDPTALYPSKAYFRIIKTEYFKLLKDDFVYFVGQYIRKFIYILKLSYLYIRKVGSIIVNEPVFFTFLAGCIFFKFKREKWIKCLSLLICSLICIFLGMVPGMMAIPTLSFYVIGVYASCGLFVFTAVMIALLFTLDIIRDKLSLKYKLMEIESIDI